MKQVNQKGRTNTFSKKKGQNNYLRAKISQR